MSLILNDAGLRDRTPWEAAGYTLPGFDRAAMRAETAARPVWVHFGAGNIFKAFQAHAAQKLLNAGRIQAGIVAVERKDGPEKRRAARGHDDLVILVTLKADGGTDKTVIGSLAETRFLFSDDPAERTRLQEVFSAPTLQMASFTITEKGYALSDGQGQPLPGVEADKDSGPEQAKTYMGAVAALLYGRFQAGGYPVAMVSMDNCARNGDRLRDAVLTFADAWAEKGLVSKGFPDWLRDTGKVSFPWTMIDKITPGPAPDVAALLAKDGLRDMDAAVTAAGTHIAPFVNAEECEYLVVEDSFPNGRPPLEEAGILFTDRETVRKVEHMKVSACLNPIHTALALYGCLLGYERVCVEMKDPELSALAHLIGYRESLPVVPDPGVLHPAAFLDEFLHRRVCNPFLPDTPQRIATDTSQKLAVRFGGTVKAWMETDDRDARSLVGIPLVFAGWLRSPARRRWKGNSPACCPTRTSSAWTCARRDWRGRCAGTSRNWRRAPARSGQC